jgi:acyl-CoA reductase-like NAD-dependent aldehyde dehydrogenase
MPVDQGLHVNGSQQESSTGQRFDDLNPFTGDVVATVAAGTPADATRAVDAAAAAFDAWSTTAPSERRNIFLRAADILSQRADSMAALMTGETGGTVGWGHFNVFLATNMLREAAAAATFPIGEVLATDMPGALSMAIRQPAGVVAAFSPFNAPIILGTRAVAVPIAVGNTLVLKAAEEAPLAAAYFIADVLTEAGLPPGVINVISSAPADTPEVASTLIADRRVRRVNFTGSTAVGRIIGEQAARHLKPAVLELGGKNALIVLDDADLDYAVQAVAFAAYVNAGQVCMSADRIIVQSGVAEEFATRLAEKAAGLATGDPSDPATVIGPLINTRAAIRVAALVDEAVRDGAKARAGGGSPDGALYPATVITDVTPGMRIFHEEIFGPVCTVITADDADQAVEIANDTAYGLSAGVLTENLTLGMDMARRLRTGLVRVNDQPVDDEAQAPFGGVQDSGYGRFGGRSGIESFTDTRWVKVQQTHRPFPM